MIGDMPMLHAAFVYAAPFSAILALIDPQIYQF